MSTKNLTSKQREFLRYINENHHCCGEGSTLEKILKAGNYDDDADKKSLKHILRVFTGLKCEMNGGVPIQGYELVNYGTPTKYLK